MTSLNALSLDQAEASFAIANTPLFLLRKLQSDPAVQEIVKSGVDGSTILRALKRAIRSKPRTLHAAVRPFVYLVALSFNREVSYLKDASELDAQYHDWFGYIARVLVETYRLTSVETVDVPNMIPSPTLDTTTNASTIIHEISVVK